MKPTPKGGLAPPVHPFMGASDWTPQKPFDLRERLLEFACLIVGVVQFLHTRGPVAAALRELKETRFRLRVLRRCDMLTREQDPVINESDELIRIVATLLRSAPRRR